MRVVQTIASTRLDHGGTSRSVPELCNALVSLGVDNYLVTAVPFDSKIECGFPSELARVRKVRESLIGRQMGVCRQFCSSIEVLLNESGDSGLVHDHAVWLPTNHAVARFCRKRRIPRIISPRGMLGTWALNHGKLKKNVAWWLYQLRDLKSASGFHATSDMEADEIRQLGLTQPIVVAPNGLNIPTTLPISNRKDRNQQSYARRFLFLSRLHPKKGLVELIRAWAHSKAPAMQCELFIAGPNESGYQSVIESLIDELQLSKSIHIVGELLGNQKWQAFVDADYFILPSYNENFGISIAESLGCGLPVITTQSTPWQIIAEQSLGWWIDNNTSSLVSAINCAIDLPELQRLTMGARAIKAVSTLNWSDSARTLANFYLAIKEAHLNG